MLNHYRIQKVVYMSVIAIIVAAGKGLRFGGKVPKQYKLLANKPVICWACEAFLNSPEIERVILAVPQGDIEFVKKDVLGNVLSGHLFAIVEGGAERSDTVCRALELVDDRDIVLIHDGARPLVEHSTIADVVKKTIDYTACVPALPASDTIKFISDAKRIISTPPRDNIYLAHTPQGFQAGLLKRAYIQASITGFHGTDDSSYVENIGTYPVVAASTQENIKITTLIDYLIAEKIMARRLS